MKTNAELQREFSVTRLLALLRAVPADPDVLSDEESSWPGVHLAVLVEPFLSFVLDGSKTVESRFTKNRIAPFRAVRPGDVILIQEVGGPIMAVTRARTVHFFESPSQEMLRGIAAQFGRAMRDDVEGFWETRSDAQFVSLIELGDIQRLKDPVRSGKRDRRGWVVLRGHETQLGLWGDM